jgi:hypothetical protein
MAGFRPSGNGVMNTDFALIFGITGNKKNFWEFCCQSNRSGAPFGGVMLPGDERQGIFTPGRERNEQTTNSE